MCLLYGNCQWYNVKRVYTSSACVKIAHYLLTFLTSKSKMKVSFGKSAIFYQKISFLPKIFFWQVIIKISSPGPKSTFWCLQSETTYPKHLQTKGFVSKHHQTHSTQLFVKIKVSYFLQNFDFRKWRFYHTFPRENESWKSSKF